MGKAMAGRRPLIGLNTTFEMDAEGGVSATRPKYWRAVLEAGGMPLLLPQLDDRAIVEEALGALDGFIMIGGYDLPGERFGEATLSTVIPIEETREKSDFALLNALISGRIPTLAICLGFQELNVVQGGTLYQDILFDGPPSEVRHYAKGLDCVHHDVEVASGTRLAEALGTDGRTEVNSVHHQAVAKVGRGLRVSATAADGIVEAIEMEDHPFMIGVQWHPETMPESKAQRRLFASLVAESARAAAAGVS